MFRVSILCSDSAHPVNEWLKVWANANADRADVTILRKANELSGGDFLFLISCHDIIEKDTRDLYRHILLIHASDLPKGRGWSPMAWEVLSGSDSITVTLLKAEDAVDSGDIWQKRRFDLNGTELLNELNAKLFDTELELMSWALDNCDTALAQAQSGKVTTYPKRSPTDSEIDPSKTLVESFDQLRISDSDRFPAFFIHRGAYYKIRLEKI